MTLSPQKGALWRQVDWEQVGALAGTGHNSPNVLLPLLQKKYDHRELK